MMQTRNLLKVGDTIRSSMGIEIKIESLLSGKGGQGYVYCVNYGGSRKILKWYKSSYLESLRQKRVRCDWQGRVKKIKEPDKSDDKEISTLEAFYNNLSFNAKNKPSNIGRAFVWPIDVTNWHAGSQSSFGYIMDIIDTKTYKELTDYYTFNARFASRHTMLTCCLNIVEEFRKLHLNGLSYQDLNDGNIYTNPNTGEIYIADNDNVTPNEVNLGVGGKDRYMAPEIVLGNAPDKYSDRFSMALILFRIMMGGQHPFEGKYSEENSEKIVYGKDPVFIFDDTDKRNAPVPTKHKNVMMMWPQYPEYIKTLFKRTFKTKIVDSGIVKKNPKTGELIHIFTDANCETRPLEEEWIRALIRLRGEMVDCPKCKKTPVFLDVKNVVTCPNCKAQLSVPCKVKCGNMVIPIVPGDIIYRCQIDMTYREFNKGIMKLLVNSTDRRMGFGNMSEDTWRIDYPDGTTATIPPRSVAEFKLGMKIHIGAHCLEITK